ncbi:methyltransferase [Streptomyces lavendulae]|uniref:methyltransferase n=1 Tax=Streptomyces lavendulae TaxID=1914 RepID=UPI00382B42E9
MEPPSPQPLYQLALGFQESAVLATAIDSGMAATLHQHGPQSDEDLTALLGLAPRGTGQFIAACCALGLLIRDADGRLRNSELATHYLLPERPGYLGGFITFMYQREYPAWHHLHEVLRSDQPATWRHTAGRTTAFDPDDEEASEFIRALHPLAVAAGTALAETVDLAANRALLDIGGGSGGYAIGLCQALPSLRVTVYDLPFVTEIARANVQEVGLTDRITCTPGNFLADGGLPQGHDVALLSNILHDWDPATNTHLLTEVHRSLEPGGLVIINELVLDNDRTGPAPAALMGLNMVVETAGGRSYTQADHQALLTQVGFTGIQTQHLELPGVNIVITAKKPQPSQENTP